MSEMHCRVVIYLIALATTLSQIAGELFVAPRNTESKIGDTTYFNCSTDLEHSEIFWYHGDKDIYTGNGILEPYNGRFEIDRTASVGSHNLVIHSVEPVDAGEYICADDEGYRERLSAQLIVLDNDPDCQSNIQLDGVIGQNIFSIAPDEVQLTCTVTYHGNIPPQLEWRKVGDVNSSTKDSVTSNVTSSNRLMHTLKLKGDISLDNSSYACHTKRSTQNQYKCTSEIVKVLYFIGGNMIEQNVIRGGEITCMASNSTFPCISQWYQGNYTCPLSCDETIIAHVLGVYLCTVRCIVRGKDYSFEAMKVVVVEPTTTPPPSATEPSPKETIIISVVVTVVVTLVVVVVLIFVFIWIVRRKKRGRSVASRDEEYYEEFQLLERRHLAICGLAILDQEVFISRIRYPDIEVYDATTFDFRRRMAVNGMICPENIVSCSVNKCLYASDGGYHSKLPAILKIDPINGNLVNTWDLYGFGGRLSVASDTNLILITDCMHGALLYEYAADGELIRKIYLGTISDRGLFEDWHAVKLPSGLFVVCHTGKYGGPQSKVCLLSIKENTSTVDILDEVEILTTYVAQKREPINRLMQPMYLSVNNEGLILVSDESNKQAVLLSSDLKKLQVLVSEEHGMESPQRTCFDEPTGQWFLADDQRVMVCLVKDEGVERKCYTLTNENTAENEGATNKRQYGGEKFGEDEVALIEPRKEPDKSAD